MRWSPPSQLDHNLLLCKPPSDQHHNCHVQQRPQQHGRVVRLAQLVRAWWDTTAPAIGTDVRLRRVHANGGPVSSRDGLRMNAVIKTVNIVERTLA